MPPDPATHLFIARCLRGIEWILAAEITAAGASIVSVEHRQVLFNMIVLSPDQLQFGTADDVFVHVGELSDIAHTRDSLDKVSAGMESLDWEHALLLLQRMHSAATPESQHPVHQWNKFTVVASFLGKQNFNRFELQAAVGNTIHTQLNLEFHEKLDSKSQLGALTVRLHLVDGTAQLSLRVFERPLHRRSYKQFAETGTLHPPLAFAMGMLAGLEEYSKILDPFCGMGTIPIEIKTRYPNTHVTGVDIDADRIDKSRLNADTANVSIDWRQADAGDLPGELGQFDRVISNPPWGNTVKAQGELENALPSHFFHNLHTLTTSDARIVLLINDADLLDSQQLVECGFTIRSAVKVSVFGQQPTLMLITKHKQNADTFNIDSAYGYYLAVAHQYASDTAAV